LKRLFHFFIPHARLSMNNLGADPHIRQRLAQRLLEVLCIAVPGSRALLRGSLGRGAADQYSDIDIFWEVPDEHFSQALGELPALLAEVHPLESLRFAPEYPKSDRRRLIFIQFKDLPLFWRLDLDIFAASLNGDTQYDSGNPAVRGDDWSPTHSALMNAIAALKALRRGKKRHAQQLLQRAFERVGLSLPAGAPQSQIRDLCDHIGQSDPTVAVLADRILDLAAEISPQDEKNADAINSGNI
jgi:predicted nucleotidyltransferase